MCSQNCLSLFPNSPLGCPGRRLREIVAAYGSGKTARISYYFMFMAMCDTVSGNFMFWLISELGEGLIHSYKRRFCCLYRRGLIKCCYEEADYFWRTLLPWSIQAAAAFLIFWSSSLHNNPGSLTLPSPSS